jgi:predicted amino acid-binding ACT domain protein
MSHTITGRAQPHGLAFDASQLASIGIRPGGTAWGVFVDSPGLDELADLSRPEYKHDNQSVHMVLSAIHPDRWLTCFRLQVYLERKRGVTNTSGSQSVAYGLFDALARCGVNVLDTSKSLMGYDAVSVVAMCEFPELRAEALRPPLRPSAEVDDRRKQLQRLRESAFRDIGRRLVHYLAVLQARLMLADELRYWRDQLKSFALAMANPTPGSAIPVMLGEYARGDGSSGDVLAPPWFVNRRILDHSENPFYLGPSRKDHQEHAEHEASFWRSFADTKDFSGCEPGVATAIFDTLHSQLVDHEDRRERAIQEGGRADRQRACESGFWTRSKKISSGEELRCHMIKGVLQRAFAFPILVSPLPTLSYARVWALPHHQVVGPRKSSLYRPEIEFEYNGTLLSPVKFRSERVPAEDMKDHERVDGEPRELVDLLVATPRELMGSIYRTVNTWSRLNPEPVQAVSSTSPHGTDDNYTFRSAVIGALNTSERFVRIRFVRPTTDARWGTLVVQFTASDVDETDRQNVSSLGLLAVFSELLAKKLFRIEDVHFRYERIDSKEERGLLYLVIQAASETNPLTDPYGLSDELLRGAKHMLPKGIKCLGIEISIGVSELA